MMMHAYDKEYLPLSQRVLGDAFDFAVNTLEYSIDDFAMYFMISDVSKQVSRGNPAYVAGHTGCELTREILRQTGLPAPTQPDVMFTDKSPEYWAGWALAFYQWYSGKSFDKIFAEIKMSEIVSMYPTYHEMDIIQFVDALDKKFDKTSLPVNLRSFRINSGLSQSKLAKAADVPLRQIQQFEQRTRDINKAQAATLFKLSRALHCRIEDLLEI